MSKALEKIKARLKAKKAKGKLDQMVAPPEPMSIHQKLRKIAENRDPKSYSEIYRITGLPVVDNLTEEEVDQVSKEVMLADAYASGERLFSPQAGGIVNFKRHGCGFYPVGVGWGKCVTAETEFFDLKSGRRRVDQCGDSTVPSMIEETGKIVPRAATVFPSGEKACVRVTLANGSFVELSTDHPVFTDRGWVNAGDLDDHLVAVPRSLPEPEVYESVSDDEVIFLAYMMSDGGTTHHPTFTNMNHTVLREFKQVCSLLGGQAVFKRKSGRADMLNVNGLRGVLEKWGQWGCSAKTKRLPASWYCLPKKQCLLFLSRFIACDGYIDKNKIEIGLANRGLLQDLQHLLLRCGIQSRISYKLAKCQTGEFDSWKLAVTGESVVRLAEAMHYVPGKYLGHLQKMEPVRHVRDVVPVGRVELAAICEESGFSKTDARNFTGASQGQRLSRAKFGDFVSEFGYEGEKAWLADSDLAWETVKSVESIGVRVVYDLNVPGTESWIANHIVVHNTLLTLMIADEAFRNGHSKIILFVPSQVYYQLTKRDIPWARKRVPLRLDFIGMHCSAGKRMGLAHSKRKGCYIIPHSMFSARDADEIIRLINPSLIIIDEAHAFKNRRTARTRRLMNYVAENHPKGVCLSGTITSKSIRDYHHLISWCLGDKSPLPLHYHMAMDWSQVLDSGAAPSDSMTGPLRPLVEWAQERFPEDPELQTMSIGAFRSAFRHRLVTAPGVVATGGDAEIGASLRILNEPVKKPEESDGWDRLRDLQSMVEDEWRTPNGDELSHAIHIYKWKVELSAGCYNELIWPSPETLAQRRGIPLPDARDQLERAQEHHAALQEYNRGLRAWIQVDAREGLDTPFLVGQDMSLHGSVNVGPHLYSLWRAAKDLEFDEMPERDSRFVRVCPYKVHHARDWAKKAKAGIIWFHHRGFGKWLHEEIPDSLYCPAGSEFNSVVADPAHKDKIIIASITAHGTGKNLQHFSKQLFTQWPRPANTAEQALGRLHRNGQEADEVETFLCNTTEIDHVNFGATLNDALYIHQTTGNRQKLIYASYDPLPVVYDPAFLKTHGAESKMLSEDLKKKLKELFGNYAG